MEDELSRWIQEAVFSSYMEECQIFNELDGAYGLNYNLVQESSSGAARKRKVKLMSRKENIMEPSLAEKNSRIG